MVPQQTALHIGRSARFVVILALVAGLAACSVWETESPEVQESSLSGSRTVDRTRIKDGQPYFLPKGMIHLVVVPAGSPGDPATAKANSPGTPVPVTTAVSMPATQLPIAATANLDLVDSPLSDKSSAGGSAGASGKQEKTVKVDVQLQYPKATPAPKMDAAKVSNHMTYHVRAELQLVPDQQAGVLYAHYSPNWLFKDNASISTTPEGLLSAVGATVEDRTPAIFDNLADTAVNVGEFLASGGFSGLTGLAQGDLAAPAVKLAASPTITNAQDFDLTKQNALNAAQIINSALHKFQDLADDIEKFYERYKKGFGKLSAPPMPSDVYIKQLNIDEVFDPLSPTDRARIEALFSDRTGSKVSPQEFSPIHIRFVIKDYTAGEKLRAAGPIPEGLWFRQPRAVEILFTQNEDYLAYLRKQLSQLKPSGLFDAQQKAQEQKDLASVLSMMVGDLLSRIKDVAPKLEDAWENIPKLIPDKSQPTQDQVQIDIGYLSRAKLELAEVQQKLGHAGTDLDQYLTALSTRASTMHDQYFGNLLGETAGLGRYSVTVPDKDRPFSINVPRSAFVARTTTLAIQSGTLLGFSHNKPSEVEGFTTIPLSLSKKLAAVPKALITSQDDSLQSQDSLIKTRTQLVADQRTLNQTIKGTPAVTATPKPAK